MDNIYEKTLLFDEVTDSAKNDSFDALGFSSLNLLKNMGSAVVFMLLEFCLIALVAVFWIIKKFFKK